ncbi:MAG: sugar ABC transporter permease [Microbacterium sp.]|jgi:multiple sugar transport system permease protein/alpha-1,4-digalacturonate transport system permease protein|uniref:carbohydrate ABC transporter permease n=1 Tax=Microbacterium sp. TaxID=51671 RepID=UPI00282805C4|nr:sugar ABC transporter permease [Microbacterium sp.]MDR2320084.1 sugar ABC transporter permease [Microbacterium sp.]
MTTTTDRPPATVQRTVASRRMRRRSILVGWSFILPNFLGFALFTLVPVLAAFVLAFMNWDAYNPPTFAGIKNFARLFGDQNFHVALGNTLLYAIGHVPLTLVCALGLAILLNQKLRGIAFFRVAIFFPYITSLVAIAIVWNMLFDPVNGPINQFLHLLGIANPPGWTSSTGWALPAVIITSVWRDMGYYMVLFLAGLQAIPQEYYEAAAMDGAGRWRTFWNITLPSLRPTTFLVLVLLSVSSFKVFDLIFVMTGGGPGRATLVLSQLIYQDGILNGQFGYSSAISLVLFLIVLLVTVFQFRIQQRRER